MICIERNCIPSLYSRVRRCRLIFPSVYIRQLEHGRVNLMFGFLVWNSPCLAFWRQTRVLYSFTTHSVTSHNSLFTTGSKVVQTVGYNTKPSLHPMLFNVNVLVIYRVYPAPPLKWIWNLVMRLSVCVFAQTQELLTTDPSLSRCRLGPCCKLQL